MTRPPHIEPNIWRCMSAEDRAYFEKPLLREHPNAKYLDEPGCENYPIITAIPGSLDRAYHEKDNHHLADTNANVESGAGNESVATKKAARHVRPVVVSIFDRRRKLADADGICHKYLIDSLIYGKILADDTTQKIRQITHRQERIAASEREETIVEICEV